MTEMRAGRLDRKQGTVLLPEREEKRPGEGGRECEGKKETLDLKAELQ